MTIARLFISGRDRNAKCGRDLTPQERAHVLRAYVHRFTREHVPQWAKQPRPCGNPYSVQFDDDKEWLCNSFFAVTKTGKLDVRVCECLSFPTWPDKGYPPNPDFPKA